MGYRDYPSLKKNSIWSDNNALMMLIIINVMVFITLHFIRTIYGLSHLSQESFQKEIFTWFSLPADLGKFLQRPWTLLTAQFTHLPPIALLSNLFWLWTFGYILQELAGNRKLIPLFIYGGLAAAITFLLAFNLVPQFIARRQVEFFSGAIPSILAIAVAATTLSPGYRIFPLISGGIPVWVCTLIFSVIDLASVSKQPGAFLPHLAGAAVGFFFARSLLIGNDWTAWLNGVYDRFVNLFNPEDKRKKRRPVKQEVFYNTRGHQPFKKTTILTQQKIDEILDKISQKGYDRLSEEEKELLKRASEEDL